MLGGIELVALEFVDGKKPIYWAVKPVSVRQYGKGADANGSNEPVGGISSEDIRRWLAGTSLVLPNEAQWDAAVAAGHPKVTELNTGVVEWMSADNAFEKPVRKDATRKTYKYNTTLPRLGFRVVFQP